MRPSPGLLGALALGGAAAASPLNPPLLSSSYGLTAAQVTGFAYGGLYGAVALALVLGGLAPRRMAAPLGWASLAGLALSSLVAAAAAAPLWALPGRPGLWGAVAHTQLATLAPLGLSLLGLRARQPTPPGGWVALGAAALALLGLLWNTEQSLLRVGWAWDWIELGPALLLFGAAYPPHRWAGRAALGGWGGLAFAGFLLLSRSALVASAHHLSPPAAHMMPALTPLPGAPLLGPQAPQGALAVLGLAWALQPCSPRPRGAVPSSPSSPF